MMKERKFGVWGDDRNTVFVVSDKHDAKDRYRPIAARFDVSDLYDEDTQLTRAREYADYLNKLNEAAKIAYQQIHLVDVLKR